MNFHLYDLPPRPLQKKLNRRLLRGDSSTPILKWLNPLPEVLAIMQADFAGAPINKQNLCDWRATGLVKWQTRRKLLDLPPLPEDGAEHNPGVGTACPHKTETPGSPSGNQMSPARQSVPPRRV